MAHGPSDPGGRHYHHESVSHESLAWHVTAWIFRDHMVSVTAGGTDSVPVPVTRRVSP